MKDLTIKNSCSEFVRYAKAFLAHFGARGQECSLDSRIPLPLRHAKMGVHLKVLAVAGLLAGLVFGPNVAAGASDCLLFEVKLDGIAANGQHHAIANIQQILRRGAAWKLSELRAFGVLDVSVTWIKELSIAEPSIQVAVAVPNKSQGELRGGAKLEKVVREHLYGPEPLLTEAGSPLVLSKEGALFAVAAVAPEECAKHPGN